MSQVQASVVPVAGQPWLSSHSVAVSTPVQQAGQQPSPAPTDTVRACFTFFFVY